MTRLLVTGATGFVGRWTLRHWRAVYPEVQLWATGHEPADLDNLADEFTVLDLCDREAVTGFVGRCKPAYVIHLAGLVGPGSLARHLSVNVVATDNLYAALSDAAFEPRPRIVHAGTAAVYGPVRPEDLPIAEDAVLQPMTPYALAKAAQEYVAQMYGRTRGLDIIRARIFNLLGPGQPGHLVPAAFIRQIRGGGGTIQVGNLNTRRDFVDVRDVACALDKLLWKGQAGAVYNVASGASVAIGDVLRKVTEMMDQRDTAIQQDDVLAQRFDIMDICGDTAAIQEMTGWRASVPLEQSLQDMIEATGVKI